jgi:hypothetical protein
MLCDRRRAGACFCSRTRHRCSVAFHSHGSGVSIHTSRAFSSRAEDEKGRRMDDRQCWRRCGCVLRSRRDHITPRYDFCTKQAQVKTLASHVKTGTFQRIPTKQKRRSTGRGAKKSLDPQRPEKRWVPDGACGHALSRPKRVSWLPAYGRIWAMSIPVSCGGVKTHVFMNDLVVAQEASDVESSSRLDFLFLHHLRRRFIA